MNFELPIIYGIKHKNEYIRERSRSGGMFTALSDLILKLGGSIYGCILDENFQAKHVRAIDEDNRNLMRGSKYVQSKTGEIYQQVENDLREDRYVLFSGTSCQIKGLKGFLRQEYDKLLAVDILCHGVPSPFIWSSYLKWLNEREGNIASINFRNKADFGWKEHVETIIFENGKKMDSKIYTNLFYGHNILRPCCYECKFKVVMHPGDITMGDFWEIDNIAPEFNDDKGVSIVLINNSKGNRFFESVKNDLCIVCADVENSFRRSMLEPYPMPEKRDEFWSDFENMRFEDLIEKYV